MSLTCHNSCLPESGAPASYSQETTDPAVHRLSVLSKGRTRPTANVCYHKLLLLTCLSQRSDYAVAVLHWGMTDVEHGKTIILIINAKEHGLRTLNITRSRARARPNPTSTTHLSRHSGRPRRAWRRAGRGRSRRGGCPRGVRLHGVVLLCRHARRVFECEDADAMQNVCCSSCTQPL